MLSRIKGLLERRGFVLFTRLHELNIVGLRSNTGEYKDEIHVFYKTGARKWNYHVFPGITNLAKVVGVDTIKSSNNISLNEGQYKNAFRFFKQSPETYLLLQTKPVKVGYPNQETEKGMYGITIQLLDKGFIAKTPYAFASQLLLDKEDFEEFKELCQKHIERYGNKFTYTLIDFRKPRKSTLEGLESITKFISSVFKSLFEKRRNRK